MGNFKRTTTVNGKYKNIIARNGEFCDAETGEIIDVADELEKIYCGNPFEISTKYSADEDVDCAND